MSDCQRTPRAEILRSLSLAVAMAAVAWSAGCGGDGGVEPTPPPDPPANRAPTASGSIPALTLTVGESVTANAATAFSDPDGDQLSYTAASSAAGVASVSVSGSTVTVTGVAAGTATITLTASDPGGLTATQGVGVTVVEGNRAPVVLLAAVPPLNYEVGDSLVLDVGPFFSDPDGDSLTFAAESSDTTVVRGHMEGSVALAWAVGAGMATVSVTASDPEGLSATLTATITVTAGNQPPMAIVSRLEPATLAVGDTLGPLDLSLAFVDPDGDTLTFTAESDNTSVVTVSVAGSMATATGVGVGNATVTVTATDPDGLSASISGEITVVQGNQAPVAVVEAVPPITGTAGDTLEVDVAPFFNDPDGDPLTFTAETSDATVLTVSVEGSVVTGVMVGEGAAAATVTATDPGGLSASLIVSVAVGRANQAPMTTVDMGASQSGMVGDTITLDVAQYFTDPDDDPLTYEAESSDAAVVTVSVEGSTATLALTGAGMATVTVTASDPGGLSASLDVSVTSEQGNRAPEDGGPLPTIPPLPAGIAQSLDVASYFSDPDGDELTYTAMSSNTSVVAVSIEGSTLTATFVSAGTATVTVTATDPGGLSHSRSLTLTVTGG